MKTTIVKSWKAKALWWCAAILALFMGAYCCAGLLFAWETENLGTGADSFWETESGYWILQHYTGHELSLWEEAQWNPALVDQQNSMEQSRMMSYELRYVDENGHTVTKLHKPFLTENGPVYRVYMQIQPDDSYYTLAACSFRGEKQDPLYWRDEGLFWQPNSSDVTLKPISPHEEEEKPFAESELRYAVLDLYLNEAALMTQAVSSAANFDHIIQVNLLLFTLFHQYIPWFAAGLLLAAVLGIAATVMLCMGAGCKSGQNGACLCWYDHLPMEMQLMGLLIAGFGSIPLIAMTLDLGDSIFYWQHLEQIPQRLQLVLALLGLILTVLGALVLVVLLSFVRWGKQGNPLRSFIMVRAMRHVLQALRIWYHALPLVWRTTLLMGGAGLLVLFLLAEYFYDAPLIPLMAGLLLWLAAYFSFVYIALGLRALKCQTEHFFSGQYAAKTEFHFYLPEMRAISNNLGRMNEGMQKAVDEQLKAERMKTELITNVSHDLKTPLTSIINYTDLLQKEALPPQAASYAQIIAKQGQRLHKLTLDLVEASKAASGVLQCEKKLTCLNELCQQTAGEYTERLEKAGLLPVLEIPDEDVTASVDGRLTWRILDNLLSNACKYAQAGTRVYLVLGKHGSSAVIQVKNISRDPLNMPAEELMERFVRGDSSRSSEGSGLGLAIARSLAELQGGRFDLYINGDLFQAEIVFPL